VLAAATALTTRVAFAGTITAPILPRPVPPASPQPTNDLFWYTPDTGVLTAWLLSPSGNLNQQVNLSWTCNPTCGRQWQPVGIGDMNEDGHADVLWFNPTTGVVSAWLLDGAGNVTKSQDLSWTCGTGCANQWKPIAIGDLNNDGQADVLWINTISGALTAWLVDRTGVVHGNLNLTRVCDTTCQSQWRPVGIGDFNSDAKADLLWFNPTSGVLRAWLLDGAGGGTSSLDLSWNCGSGCSNTWQPVGVDDLNFDQHVDVEWYQRTTGAVSGWLLNSSGTVVGTQSASVPCNTAHGCGPGIKPLGIE
jgi:hypothetical protein